MFYIVTSTDHNGHRSGTELASLDKAVDVARDRAHDPHVRTVTVSHDGIVVWQYPGGDTGTTTQP